MFTLEEIVIICSGSSGGHAKLIIDALEKANRKIKGIIDNQRQPGERLYGYEVLGDEEYVKRNSIDTGIVGIGDNWKRKQAVKRVKEINPFFKFTVVIHPYTSIARGVTIGEGTVVMAGAIINSDAQIGEHCIVNTKSSIAHDCEIGDYVSISPSATLGGNVLVGVGSNVAMGVNVIHAVTIGQHTVIGAGSTVLNDIEDYKVAYGTPAKAVKVRKEFDTYL